LKMKTIWKFPLAAAYMQEVAMPKGARALSVKVQPGVGACLWALVDDELPHNQRLPVWMVGTGQDAGRAPVEGRYVSTLQLAGGTLVFHFFVKDGY
jgi:hypothetical protein